MNQTPENETPRQAHVPTKLSQFVKHQDNRATLKRILKEPAFIAAMNMLGEEDKVTDHMLSSLQDTVLARKIAKHAGVSGVYERLEGLAALTTDVEDFTPWEHLSNQNNIL